MTAQIQKRPFVTLKSAVSLDGKVNYGTNATEKKNNFSEKTHGQSHMLRSMRNAIAVGAGTILDDNPMLNCNLNGLEQFSPDIIIFDRTLRTAENSHIFQNNNVRKIFIHDPEYKQDYLQKDDVYSISSQQPLEKYCKILAQ